MEFMQILRLLSIFEDLKIMIGRGITPFSDAGHDSSQDHIVYDDEHLDHSFEEYACFPIAADTVCDELHHDLVSTMDEVITDSTGVPAICRFCRSEEYDDACILIRFYNETSVIRIDAEGWCIDGEGPLL